MTFIFEILSIRKIGELKIILNGTKIGCCNFILVLYNKRNSFQKKKYQMRRSTYDYKRIFARVIVKFLNNLLYNYF